MFLSPNFLPDGVAILHAGYIAFVVVGFLLILVGIARQWSCARNFWFRVAHLLAIALVCAESLIGLSCPLTLLEDWLRTMGGGSGYSRGFVGYWLDRLIFYDFPSWVFMLGYAGFGLVVAAVFIIAPPRRRSRLAGGERGRAS